jgi:hypothetical protein
LDRAFRVFPFIFYATKSNETTSWPMVYDIDNHIFLLNRGAYCGKPNESPSDPFTWQRPSNHVLVHGANIVTGNSGTDANYGGNSCALMKDNAGKWYILIFGAALNSKVSTDVNAPGKVAYYEINEAVLPRIADAKLFAFSTTRTLMFYAVDRTLYAYDYVSTALHQMQFDDEITMIKFDLYCNRDYTDLYIATYNPATKGRFQKYVLGADPNVLGLEADPRCRWDGLVKVVDMDWRNSTRAYPPHR